MKISDLNHKKICILGFGREGRATLEVLKKYAPEAKITIADANPDIGAPEGLPAITGPDYLEKLSDFDAIIKSPGIPWHPSPEIATKLTSATEIFLDSLPNTSRVVGITGTKGKSSTANLIYQALKAGGKQVVLAGNIGQPMLGYLEGATPDTIYVLELSSYQLENLRTSPQIAVITSFFPDHLDYHGSLRSYLEAKQNITRHQQKSDDVFYNPAYPECLETANLSPGKKIPFTEADYPRGRDQTASHENLVNLAAAYKVATHLGVAAGIALQALESAQGLPHRQQRLGRIHGIEWVDDSGATTPQSTIAALEALGGEVGTIIVGGLDRGYDFAALGAQLATSGIGHIVLFPDTGAKIRAAIEATPGCKPKHYLETSSMEEAVAYALHHTQPGQTCLLSSGSPSYNLFKNYYDRGDAFREAIHKAK